MTVGRAGPRVVAGVLIAAGVVSSLVYSLAMPLIAVFPDEFGVSASSATWIVVANSVTGAVATPVMGRMGDLWGPRRTLVWAMCALVVGSAVCALAPNLVVMVIGRVLQGAASGTVPLGIGILRSVLPDRRIGVAVGMLSATLGVGSGVGITVAGVIMAHGSWRAVFAATAVLAAVVVVLIVVVIPGEIRATVRGLDVAGVVGLGAMLTLILVPVSKGSDWGWGSPMLWSMIVSGAVIGVLWTRYQARRDRPLVNVRAVWSGRLAGVNVIACVVGAGIFFSLLTVVMVIQAPPVTGYGLGRSVLVAGLALIPGNLTMVVAPIPAARWARAHGVRSLLRIGLSVMACGYAFRTLFEDSLADVVAGYLFVQAGVAICLAGLPMAIVRSAPVEETSSTQAVSSTMRYVGIAAAGAAYAAIVAASHVDVGGHLYPTADALSLTFSIAAGISLGGVIGTFVRAGPTSRRGRDVERG